MLRTAVPLAGVLAASLLTYVASEAAFTASTTTPGNNWAAGQVVLTNNTGPGNSHVVNGSARFTATNIYPGDQLQRCISVRSDGGFAGSLKTYVANVGGTGLQNRIRLRIQRAPLPSGTGPGTSIPANCAGFPAGTQTTVYNNFLTALPTSYAGATDTYAVAAGATGNAVYRIRWQFVSTGSSAGDNVYQGTNATADLVWELQ
jgi:hypothetical protein